MTIHPIIIDYEHLAAIIDSLPDPTFGINTTGEVIAWNRAIENLTRISAANIIGKGNYEYALPVYGLRRPMLIDMVQHPDDEIRKFYPDFTRFNNQISTEFQLQTSENKSLYIRTTATTVLGRDNHPLGFIQTIHDQTQYKEAESELIRQRESLGQIMEHTPVGTAIADPEGRIEYINHRTIEMTGYTIEEIPTTKAWFELAYPNDKYRHQVTDFWRQQLENGDQAKGMAKIRHKDGMIRYLEFQAVKLWDGRTITSIWDLTPQKEVEEALRSSEEKFRALSEASLEGILFLENGYCIESNKKGPEMLGYQYDEIIGMPTLDLVAPESRQLVTDNIQANYELPYEITALHKDGSVLPLEVQGRNFLYLGRTVRATVLNDLSERKRAQEQIELQNRNLSALFRNSPDALVLGNLDQVILDVNPRFTELFGFEKDECLGRYLPDLIVPADLLEEYYSNAKQTSLIQLVSLETVRRNKAGEIIDVSVNVVPVEGFGFYAMYSDISERRRNENLIQHQMRELEAKNAEMERFTYTVSHDLRSPLITIQGFSSLLLEDIKNDEFKRLESDLSRIINASSKMDQLLQDLLELSRIGRISNPPSRFSMDEPVHEVVELLAGPIASSGVDITIADSFPLINADRSRIREVLQNLIENAIKFMGDQASPLIQIGYLPGEDENIFFVRDNGIGIDSCYLEKVFGLFEQLDASNEGTGIGLALVKRIVEFHEGRIWVESEGPGKGATFFFTLPDAN